MSKPKKISRRKFLKTSSLVGAAAILPAGRSSTGLMLKHLVPEDDRIPGVADWLFSTCNECPAGCGVQVRLINSNATKIEGNEQNPINHGGLCARGQSALEGLYSPARVQSPLRRNDYGQFDKISWPSAVEQIKKAGQSGKSPGKVVVVGRQITGGIKTMMDKLASELPGLELIIYEPLDYAPIATANKLCFGIDAIPIYSFDKASMIVSFGADFLETWLSPVSYAYGYYLSRGLTGGPMSRFIQFESHMSLTGANADERYALPPGGETLVALAIASQMLAEGTSAAEELKEWRSVLQPFTPEKAARASGVSPEIIKRTAERLRSQTPSLALAGGPTSRSTYATPLQIAVNLINSAAGNYGKTITFDRTENSPVGTYTQLLGLVEEMEAGRIAMLVVHDVNPEFAFPDPERLKKAMKNVPLKVHLAAVKGDSIGLYDIVLPVLYWLEMWDLVEPRSGLKSLRQPIIEPFTDARNPGQVLADLVLAWSGKTGEPAFEYEKFVQNEWEEVRKAAAPDTSFDDFWKQVLKQGGIWLEPEERKVELQSGAAKSLEGVSAKISVPKQQTLLPITTVRYGDGRQTGRLWLNELPDPITTVVWDDPLLISPATAKSWGCGSGDKVHLSAGKTAVKLPAYVQPEANDSVVAVALGTASDKYAPYHSHPDGNPLRQLSGDVDELSGSLSWIGTPINFESIVGYVPLARDQGSFHQGAREIALAIPRSEMEKPEKEETELPPPSLSELYPRYKYPVHKWGMVIDLAACIGCGACAVACQAENNVMIVGKKQCLNGRQLSWMRIQRFTDHGHTVFLPMLCQQCGHAPCESVCPVYASVHNDEGLNVQVYNRCVGTRYCANNCPYKVRHFNWFTYTYESPLEKQLNPGVSVRTRGIMEKCTFCIQRIRDEKENAKDEGRPLRDGEIIPACAQSCPTRAIVFGDLRNPESRVSKLSKEPRGYTIFRELNTHPSVVYLKHIYHSDSKPERSP